MASLVRLRCCRPDAAALTLVRPCATRAWRWRRGESGTRSVAQHEEQNTTVAMLG
jgi:hypothetical protein